MAAKIGILGETTSLSLATTTLYTVPSSKAARVRVFCALEGGAGATELSWLIGSPGAEITCHFTVDSGDDVWTGLLAISTPDPPRSIIVNNSFGWQQKNAAFVLPTPTAAQDWWIAPLPVDYFLSTGDTVKVIVGVTAPLDFLAQVYGVEDDA